MNKIFIVIVMILLFSFVGCMADESKTSSNYDQPSQTVVSEDSDTTESDLSEQSGESQDTEQSSNSNTSDSSQSSNSSEYETSRISI